VFTTSPFTSTVTRLAEFYWNFAAKFRKDGSPASLYFSYNCVSLPWVRGEPSFLNFARNSNRIRLGRVTVDVNGDVVNTQFALREGIAHQCR